MGQEIIFLLPNTACSKRDWRGFAAGAQLITSTDTKHSTHAFKRGDLGSREVRGAGGARPESYVLSQPWIQLENKKQITMIF